MKMNARTGRIGRNAVAVVMSLMGALAVGDMLFRHHADAFDYIFAVIMIVGLAAGVAFIRMM